MTVGDQIRGKGGEWLLISHEVMTEEGMLKAVKRISHCEGKQPVTFK